MNEVALPVPAARKSNFWLMIAAALVLCIGSAVVWLVFNVRGGGAVAPSGMIYTVVPMDLDIKIQKDGELQALNNIEISSQVEGQTTIQTIVPEGATVKKGDVLITLDSSAIKQKIEDTTLELQKAEADLTTSQELLGIQQDQNAADLEAANVALVLAKLDLTQYVEGTYPQQLATAKIELEMAETNLKNQQEKLGQTKALFAKQFVTQTAVKDDELAVKTAENAVTTAQTALKVLTEYTHEMDLASKKNALSQAEQKLVRQRRMNASNLAQRNADVQAKTQALAVMKRRMERYQEQFAACSITAPADGLVVYGTTGDRNAQNQIQEGATVRERQLLLRLPDTSAMKAVVRISESQVSRLQEGLRARVKIVGVPNPIGATLEKISVLADSGQRFFNPDLKEYPVDLVLDETPASLKPGMGAMTEIYVDHASNVIAVPLSTIYSSGPDAYVFVQEQDHVTPRKVRIGRTNESHAELLGDAVRPNEQLVMLQIGEGPALLERAGIKISTTQPSGDFQTGTRRNGRGRRGGGGGNASGAAAPANAPAINQQPRPTTPTNEAQAPPAPAAQAS
jgi:HlyD family secretion protein